MHFLSFVCTILIVWDSNTVTTLNSWDYWPRVKVHTFKSLDFRCSSLLNASHSFPVKLAKSCLTSLSTLWSHTRTHTHFQLTARLLVPCGQFNTHLQTYAPGGFSLLLPFHCIWVCLCGFLLAAFFWCLVTALDIPYHQPCLQYTLAWWLCFCLLERYSRSLNLKQKAEPVVWTMRNLFLR